jgi:pyrimidine operon attenuation protein / uracil phosphoribosyltransferase
VSVDQHSQQIAAPQQLIKKLASSLQSFLAERQRSEALLVGLHRGGVWVAQALHAELQLRDPPASLDVSFYRDDFQTAGLQSAALGSDIPVDINQRHVVLVDDILYTGRTIRAAMNGLFDFGRPASITLAVLIQRDGRELPIQADCCAAELQLEPAQSIKLLRESDGSLSLQRKERVRA